MVQAWQRYGIGNAGAWNLNGYCWKHIPADSVFDLREIHNWDRVGSFLMLLAVPYFFLQTSRDKPGLSSSILQEYLIAFVT